MSNVAIHVEGLGKKFHIGGRKKQFNTLGETITETVHSSLRAAKSLVSGERNNGGKETVWALKDVTFDINHGDVVGIIGSNGAGKSTLLKILSRITVPTKGLADIHGRVGSLLEVGTGFHQELTGRENIYLNGAILGMKRREIDRKLDEIVDFSEVGRYIDTPVKHFSSGMYLRLAFAVAAHLEPEILMVDEVLAVGDAAFQKKCLGKMGDVAKQGRTVLFVSHNMGAIIQLCPTSIVMQKGTLVDQGPSKSVVESYLAKQFEQSDNFQLESVADRKGNGLLQFSAVYLRNEAGDPVALPISGHPIDIVLDFVAQQDLPQVEFALTIYNQIGAAVSHCSVKAFGKSFNVRQGKGQIICHLKKLPLPLGQYRIAIRADNISGSLDFLTTACVFNVETSNFFATSFTPPMRYSTALIEHDWDVKQ